MLGRATVTIMPSIFVMGTPLEKAVALYGITTNCHGKILTARSSGATLASNSICQHLTLIKTEDTVSVTEWRRNIFYHSEVLVLAPRLDLIDHFLAMA